MQEIEVQRLSKPNILLITAVLLCLAGIGQAADPVAPDPVILKVWKLPDPKKTDAFNRADLAVVDAFRKKSPHIELRPFSGIQIERMERMDSLP